MQLGGASAREMGSIHRYQNSIDKNGYSVAYRGRRILSPAEVGEIQTRLNRVLGTGRAEAGKLLHWSRVQRYVTSLRDQI